MNEENNKSTEVKAECCNEEKECCSESSKDSSESCCSKDKSKCNSENKSKDEASCCKIKSAGFCPVTILKSAINIDNIIKALLRAKAVMLSPKESFASIKAEKKSVNEIYKQYSAPLALIAFLCQFIGMAVIGLSAPLLGTLRWPIFSGLIYTIVVIVFHLLSLFLVGKALEFISEKFSEKKDSNLCFAFAAYVTTPVYFAYILSIIPALSGIGLLFSLYAIYLVFLATSEILDIEAEKKVVFTILTLLSFLIVKLVFAFISMAVNPTVHSLAMKSENIQTYDSKNIENSLENIISNGIKEIQKNN
jgi:hypothetical protein